MNLNISTSNNTYKPTFNGQVKYSWALKKAILKAPEKEKKLFFEYIKKANSINDGKIFYLDEFLQKNIYAPQKGFSKETHFYYGNLTPLQVRPIDWSNTKSDEWTHYEQVLNKINYIFKQLYSIENDKQCDLKGQELIDEILKYCVK